MQRRLTGLGFDTKVTGAFTDETRTVLKRWQAARGYPSTRLPQQAPAQGPAVRDRGDRAGHRERRQREAGPACCPGPGPERAPVQHRNSGGGDAGAAFVGGVVGGMMGGMFRR